MKQTFQEDADLGMVASAPALRLPEVGGLSDPKRTFPWGVDTPQPVILVPGGGRGLLLRREPSTPWPGLIPMTQLLSDSAPHSK